MIGAHGDTRRHVRINRVSPNNYADTATRDDTRCGAPPGKFPWCTIINGTPISILVDISELTPPALPRRRPTNISKRLRAVYPICRTSFPRYSRFSSSCRVSRSSSAWPDRERNDARVGPDDKCRTIMRQVVSKVSAMTSGCYMHARYHRRGTTAVSPLGNKHSRLSFMRCDRTARSPLTSISIVLRNLERSMWAIKTVSRRLSLSMSGDLVSFNLIKRKRRGTDCIYDKFRIRDV